VFHGPWAIFDKHRRNGCYGRGATVLLVGSAKAVTQAGEGARGEFIHPDWADNQVTSDKTVASHKGCCRGIVENDHIIRAQVHTGELAFQPLRDEGGVAVVVVLRCIDANLQLFQLLLRWDEVRPIFTKRLFDDLIEGFGGEKSPNAQHVAKASVYAAICRNSKVLQLFRGEVGIVAEHLRCIALWVIIDDQDLQPHEPQINGQIHAVGGFGRTPFLHVCGDRHRPLERSGKTFAAAQGSDLEQVSRGVHTTRNRAAIDPANLYSWLVFDQAQCALRDA